MFPKPLRIMLGIAATGAVAATVVAALAGDWDVASWAFTAAGALTLLAVVPTPPRPVRAERGLIAITFQGGPLDGADIPLPGAPPVDLLGEHLHVDGTRYRIANVDHTCFTAEVEAPAERAER